MTTGSLKGRLLIALPALRDPNFDRSIVLMLHHDDDGAVGVILNRPSQVEVADALPQWRHRLASPAVFFHGGPVGPSAAICLARVGGQSPGDGWQRLLDRVGTFDLTQDPDEVGDEVEELRVFSGYAGWRGGQLEDELDVGAWLVAEAAPDDALTDAPDDLWRTVLRRQRGEVALLASFPPDPSLN
jgi:putative transcriptional regulator